jgi:hypothetical protein
MMEIYTASKKLAPTKLDIPEKSDKANKPQPAEEVLVKTIDLGTGDSSKTARTAGSTSDMSQLPILGPTDKSSAAMGWCSTLSRSGYTTLLTPNEASGSRNYPMHSGGYVLSPPSQRGNPLTSWSMAPKQSSLLMSYGIH